MMMDVLLEEDENSLASSPMLHNGDVLLTEQVNISLFTIFSQAQQFQSFSC